MIVDAAIINYRKTGIEPRGKTKAIWSTKVDDARSAKCGAATGGKASRSLAPETALAQKIA
jgi:hypothetical protein